MTEMYVFVLYGCESLSHTVAEEQKLRVFENWVLLKKILVPNRQEVRGAWGKLHNEDLHDLYCH
jgi:hypothetical protein